MCLCNKCQCIKPNCIDLFSNQTESYGIISIYCITHRSCIGAHVSLCVSNLIERERSLFYSCSPGDFPSRPPHMYSLLVIYQFQAHLVYIPQVGYVSVCACMNLSVFVCKPIGLVDYGLAYRYSPEGILKEYKEDPKRCHDGTIEFTSINAHKGVCKYTSPRLQPSQGHVNLGANVGGGKWFETEHFFKKIVD